MMKYSAFSIIIAGFLTPLPLAAVEFNINAIDKDQRGKDDKSNNRPLVSAHAIEFTE